jgi:hypothetical protein
MKNKTRISYKNSFELCYLRHQYLRKAKYNPTADDLKPYSKIVEKFANNTYYVYKNLFILVGLDVEDVVNIAQVQLVSYLGSFALERNPKKLEAFKKTFRSHNSIRCSENDLLDKNKANFTCFLKQRMEDLVRVCKQKARNIKGLPTDEFVVFTGSKQPPNDIEELLDSHEWYGYKPVSNSAFKTIKKQLENQQGPVYLLDENWYVCVPLKRKALSLHDFTCQDHNPYDSLHNMTPEDIFQKSQEEYQSQDKYTEFHSFSNTDKCRIVKMFMSENKKNPELEEEVRFAKKYLETLSAN